MLKAASARQQLSAAPFLFWLGEVGGSTKAPPPERVASSATRIKSIILLHLAEALASLQVVRVSLRCYQSH